MKLYVFLTTVILATISFTSIAQIGNTTDTSKTKTDSTEYKIFDKVDIEASFPGGDQAWRKFLEKNLNAQVAADNGAPIGIYTVIAQFIVDKEGNVTDIKALTNYGYGLEKEVLRALKLQTHWSPAMQNGEPVKAYRKQPVTFVMEGDGIEILSKERFVLYTDIDNVITINVRKVRDEDLELTITQGTIIATGNGSYTVRLKNPGKAIIEIFNRKKKKASLAEIYFTVRSRPK